MNYVFVCGMHAICLFFLLTIFSASGSKSAIVTNTTVEIIVPENVIGSVYGENGTNLARLRQVFHFHLCIVASSVIFTKRLSFLWLARAPFKFVACWLSKLKIFISFCYFGGLLVSTKS